MGGAMLSKFLIQFSVVGGAVFPPCYLPEAKLWTTDFPGGSDSKASTYSAGDLGSIPGSGRSSGEGNGNQLQYSCLENPIDIGA